MTFETLLKIQDEIVQNHLETIFSKLETFIEGQQEIKEVQNNKIRGYLGRCRNGIDQLRSKDLTAKTVNSVSLLQGIWISKILDIV